MNTKATADHIVNWLNQYLENSPAEGFVVGVSGGIDSAVVSTLAARTGKPVLLLEMPILQKKDQVARAQKHMAHLAEKYPNVKTKTVDLTPIYQAFEKTVEADKNTPKTELALANTRSRQRMATLYYYDTINNFLVTGTGNKVEDFGVGFFTKYGDGGVDLSPIADLVKSEVYQLGKHLEVNTDIQKAAPTDGLWSEDRTDEQQIGATYPELEWAMSVYPTKDTNPFSDRQKEVYEIYDKLHRSMQHKITPIPVCELPDSVKNLC